jgi:hypothetical protein
MGLDDVIGHGALFGFGLISGLSGQGLDLFGFAFGDDLGAVYKVNAAVIELDHDDFLLK